MKRWRFIPLFLIVILPLPVSGAVDSVALSLDDCIRLAVQNNKDIAYARKQVEQYASTSRSLRANYFPKVSLQAIEFYGTLSGQIPIDVAGPISAVVTEKFTRMLPTIASGDMGSWYISTLPDRLSKYNQTMDYKLGNIFSTMLMVEQPIYAGGKIASSVKMGKLGLAMSELNTGITEDETIVKVIEAYSQFLFARDMGNLAEQSDSLIMALYDKVEDLLANGMVSQADLMKVRSAQSQSKLQIRQAENGQLLARMNLCHILGIPLTSDIDILPIDSLSATGISADVPDITNRREYEILQAKTELAGLQIEMEKSNFKPVVGLALSGGYIDGIEINDNKLMDKKMHGFVALNVKIPILHAGEGRHKIKAARAEYDQAVIEQQKYNELMTLEIQKSLNELDEARLKVELCETVRDEAEECFRVSRKTYDMGMETTSDLLEAQTQYNKACTDLADARHQYIIKEASFLKASGKLQEKYRFL